MNALHPKKLLLTKWTALHPTSKEKHFLVTRLIVPALPDGMVESVEVEAVYSKNTHIISWRELRDETIWRQGWV